MTSGSREKLSEDPTPSEDGGDSEAAGQEEAEEEPDALDEGDEGEPDEGADEEVGISQSQCLSCLRLVRWRLSPKPPRRHFFL